MKKLLAKLISKNELTLIGGTLGAQLIPFAVSPILTRLFTPEAFGIFGLFYSSMMILAVLMNGKYETALLLEEDEKNIPNLLGLNLLATAVVVLLSFAVLGILHEQIATLFKLKNLSDYWHWLPPALFGISLFFIGYNLLNRYAKYGRLAAAKIIRTAIIALVAIGLGLYLGAPQMGLTHAEAIGQFMAGIIMLGLTWKYLPPLDFNFSSIKKLAKKYKKFPLFIIPSSFANTTAANIPFFYFGTLGAELTGIYTLTHRITYAPSAIVATSFADVFKQQASQALRDKNNCAALFKKTLLQLAALGLVPYLILQFLSVPIFTFVFGDEWAQSGELTQILAPLFYIQFIASPLSTALVLTQRQNQVFYLQILQLAMVGSAAFAAISADLSPEVGLATLVAANAFKYIFEFFLSYRASNLGYAS